MVEQLSGRHQPTLHMITDTSTAPSLWEPFSAQLHFGHLQFCAQCVELCGIKTSSESNDLRPQFGFGRFFAFTYHAIILLCLYVLQSLSAQAMIHVAQLHLAHAREHMLIHSFLQLPRWSHPAEASSSKPAVLRGSFTLPHDVKHAPRRSASR